MSDFHLDSLISSFRRRHLREPEVCETCDAIVEHLQSGKPTAAAILWNELILSRNDWPTSDLDLARKIDLEFSLHNHSKAELATETGEHSHLAQKHNRRVREKRILRRKIYHTLKRILMITITSLLLVVLIGRIVVFDFDNSSPALLFVLCVLVILTSYSLWCSFRAKPEDIDKIFERINWLP